MSTELTLNENIVKFDNLLTGLNYLLDEVQERKENALSDSAISEKLRYHMDDRTFIQRLVSHMISHQGDSLYREVAFMVMEKIDKDIEAFINSRVEDKLRELGVISN